MYINARISFCLFLLSITCKTMKFYTLSGHKVSVKKRVLVTVLSHKEPELILTGYVSWTDRSNLVTEISNSKVHIDKGLGTIRARSDGAEISQH